MTINRQQLASRFESLIEKLFELEGFDVRRPDGRAPFDFYITSKSGVKSILEAKLMFSSGIPTATMLEMAERLDRARAYANASHGVLAVAGRSLRLRPNVLAQRFPSIVLYDFPALSYLVGKHLDLAVEFERIIREGVYRPEGLLSESPESASTFELQRAPEEALTTIIFGTRHGHETKKFDEGERICSQISQIPAGKEGARDFEKYVMNALDYLFAGHLVGWSRQHATETGMSIYDSVARIASQHDFWKTLISAFRSRYVIFEFKNYADPIDQGQIYTTEKYLFATALRNVAIIVARNGADENAQWAAKGALKEHGKLILIVSLAEVCEMLRKKDQGDDPSDYLLTKLDDFLTRLER